MVTYRDAIARARELLGTPYGTGEGQLDCIGLIVRVIRTAPGGVRGYKTAGTDTLWSSYNSAQKYRDLNWRRVGTAGARPGMLAFKGSGTDKQGDGQPHHVGLVAEKGGELTVIHASSANGRVVETPLYGPYGWTLLAIHRYIQTEEEGDEEMPQTETQYTARVTTQSGGLRLRSGAGPGYPIITTIPRGATVEVLMEFEVGWDFVRYGKQTGYVSAEYLTPVNAMETPSEPPKEPDGETPTDMTWGVFIGNLSEEKAREIADGFPGSILTMYKGGSD